MLNRCVIAAALVFAVSFGARAQEAERPQVSVSVKIIEFQTTKGVETGISAYFKRRDEIRPYGRVSSGNGNISAADITFPNSTNAGITVFLDRLTNAYGDVEVVLQALVDQNRASILARPRAMVPVGQGVETVIKTTQKIPFENTVVVGATAVQTTDFRETGVSLSILANQIVDDDGNPATLEDSYINLTLNATVNEEGQRITVALDDQLAGQTGPFSETSNAISVPEFISRNITTTVWVRNGQVLILGGLYRSSKNKSVATAPWLAQGEDLLNATVSRLMPLAVPEVPLTTGLGNTSTSDSRRELVFMIKAEVWKPAFTVADEFGFTEEEEDTSASDKKRLSPTDVITEIVGGISEIPKGVAGGISGGTEGGVSSSLGGGED